YCFFFFFQAEDGIRDFHVTGVQTCALPIYVVAYGIGSPAFALAFVWACALVLGSRPTWIAYLTALLIWLPFPVLQALFLLPALRSEERRVGKECGAGGARGSGSDNGGVSLA